MEAPDRTAGRTDGPDDAARPTATTPFPALADPALADLLDRALARPGRVVALTGAGISAESGIPTFRGPEGYWSVGSRVYRPQELATWATFVRDPELVWPWYLWRRSVCRAAAPNPAHHALVALDGALGDRFRLVTQNVDGLHLRAGSPPERTWTIHGNIEQMRCAAECGAPPEPLPEDLSAGPDDTRLTPAARSALRCGRCGGWMRPHVLWFDETYDEPRYRFESALRAAREATLLLVVGTTGSTNLPVLMGREALHHGATLVDVNPVESPFGAAAERAGRGLSVRDTAATALPAVVGHVIGRHLIGGQVGGAAARTPDPEGGP